MKPFALFGTIVLLSISATAGAAAPDPQVVAPIRQFIDSFNKGDTKAAAATHTPSGVTIIDEIAPFVWAGPGAFDAWSKALAAFDQKEGNSDGAVALGEPTSVYVSGDRGYVVAPVIYTFKTKDVAMRETAQIVVALQKGTGGWKIASWTWVATTPRKQ